MLAAADLTELYPVLRRRALDLTAGDDATADDLTQETVLRLLESDVSAAKGGVKLRRYARLAMLAIWRLWGYEAP